MIHNDGLPLPNPNDAGPIVYRPMGLPIMASCDTAWNQTRVCSDTSSTEMQCIRPLGSSWLINFNLLNNNTNVILFLYYNFSEILYYNMQMWKISINRCIVKTLQGVYRADCGYTVPVKSLDTPTHSRVFLYFHYLLHCIIIVKTSNLWNNTYGIM
jgi:hypothetical protein